MNDEAVAEKAAAVFFAGFRGAAAFPSVPLRPLAALPNYFSESCKNHLPPAG